MTRYITLPEYLFLAELVTGVPAETLARSSRIELADSALHAPASGFGDIEFHPSLVEKAAALCWHLSSNHPLPDGNKRSAWAAMTMFIDLNRGSWKSDQPNVDESEKAMVAVAGGEMTTQQLAKWLSDRVVFS